jgi:hypothetical protein
LFETAQGVFRNQKSDRGCAKAYTLPAAAMLVNAKCVKNNIMINFSYFILLDNI